MQDTLNILEGNSSSRAQVAARYRGLCVPLPHQRELLRVLFLEEESACAAYARLAPHLDIDGLDGGSLALLPLLGRRLQELGLRDPRLARLQGLRRYHFCRNSLLVRGAAEVQALLQDVGISCTSLKGLAVIAHYPDLGLRAMHDIDFLVSPACFAQAERRLLQYGFLHKPPPQPHARAFVRDALELDLHFHSLVEDPRTEADVPLLTRVEPILVGGVTLHRARPALTLAHLLVHGSRFSLSRPIHWAADAIHLLGAGSVDFAEFRQHVVDRELMVPALETLRYLSDDLRVELPTGLLDELESHATTLHWAEYACYSSHPRRVGSAHRTAARLCHRARLSRAVGVRDHSSERRDGGSR